MALIPPRSTGRNRIAGALGGRKAAMLLSAEQRSQRSSNAGNAVLLRYGVGYYSALVRLSNAKQRPRSKTA